MTTRQDDMMPPIEAGKVFYVDGFGEVGEANLMCSGITAHVSGPYWFNLEVGQSCDMVTKDGPLRVTRTR